MPSASPACPDIQPFPHFGTHSLRHTYRSWLSRDGNSKEIQRRLMRHADIRTTMNVYGDADEDQMEKAHSRIVGTILQ